MEKINKTISLEQFKTRFPLTYPSLQDGQINWVTEQSLAIWPNANYGSIPLGINEEICGDYSGFTQEMHDLYHGTILNYKVLERWYIQFLDYYKLLSSNSCGDNYSSATQYYQSFNDNEVNQAYIDLDIQHQEHGGTSFYNWLTDNYFVCLHLDGLYQMAQLDGKDLAFTYSDWKKYVNNLGQSILYYPDALYLQKQLKTWQAKYNDVDCSDSQNCCECSQFTAYGGTNMLNMLTYWINKVQNKIKALRQLMQSPNLNLQALSEKIELKISLKQKVADLGNYTIFSKAYNSHEKYEIGNVCTYDNIVYYLKDGEAHVFDSTLQHNRINLWTVDSPNGWIPYIQQYKGSYTTSGQSFQEFHNWETTDKLSGRTVSSLESFAWDVDTVDNVGHILRGHFTPNSGSTFIQPPENTCLDLEYQLGKLTNITSASGKTYVGDLLERAILYLKDNDGITLTKSIVVCKDGDNISSKIEECTNKTSTDESDGVVYIDFVYVKNTLVKYDDNGKAYLVTDTNNNIYGVVCREHCKLNKLSALYYLTPTDCYPIYYYQVIRDTETVYSSDYDTTISVNMTDFEFMPAMYAMEDTIAAPLLRKEELLGITGPENTTKNIYIDRGYATALEKHLKLGDITSFETLENYGNGTLTVLNPQEENI